MPTKTKQPKTDSVEERLKGGLFKLSLTQPVIANDIGLSTYKTKELLGFVRQEISKARREEWERFERIIDSLETGEGDKFNKTVRDQLKHKLS